MTPQQFAELVAEGDLGKIAEAAATLNESQRRKLWKGFSKFVVDPIREVTRPPGSKPDTLDMLSERLNRHGPNRVAVELARLALGPLSEARKIGGGFDDAWASGASKVLRDRRPAWIDQWIESSLQGPFPRFSWKLLRSLIKNGICRKPECDGYVRCMAIGLRASQFRPPYGPISQSFVEEPDLLDDVWRLFEVDTGWLGDDDPKWYREAPPSYETLATALVKLSELGHLDRHRLIDGCLNAIQGGFKDQALTGFMRFHAALRPTVEELAARQATYVDLLANRASHVVTFALERLNEIERGGRLDDEAFLAVVTPVFQIRTKVQAKTALQLISRITQRRPELVPQAAAGVIEALAHPAPEVQEQAITLLESWSSRLHADHAIEVRQRLGDLAASIRCRAERVASQLRPVAEPTERSADQEFGLKFEELARDAETSISPWRERAGVDEALESLRAGRMPRPLEFDLLEARVLAGVAPIAPIQSVDELLDAVAHAVETMDSADELERILDGISRLCDQRPPDFHRRSDPLVKRLTDSHAVDEFSRLLADRMSESFYQLLMVWLCGPWPASRYNAITLHRFFDGRVQELIQRVVQRRAQPLLAAPTHEGGWIDPVIFIKRLAALFQSGDEPPSFDLIQAILRLAPDGRQKALAAAGELPGHVGRAVRWCLGSDEAPNPEDGSHTSLWLAAGRARYPTGTLEDLRVLKIGKDQPDAFVPARYVWKPQTRPDTSLRWRHDFYPIAMTVEPEPPFDGGIAVWPTVALHLRHEHVQHVLAWQCCFLTTWRIGMISQVWPLCLDPLLVGGVYALGQRLDMPASTLAPNHAFLRPWLEPDRPWSELAYLAVWLALISKDADSRQVGLDALVQAVGDGRANAATMAGVLARLIPGGWVKLNRAADALSETARLSPLHTWFAAEMLQGFLTRLAELPRDAHFVLSLLRELLADLGTALSPSSRTFLETVQGTTKTAKAARALLDLKPAADPAKLRLAGIQALEARIVRARRWSGEDLAVKESVRPGDLRRAR